MDLNKQVLDLKEIFTDLVPGFGLNHARVYYALISSEVKTANQVIEETGVNQATTYSVLRDLDEWGLINCSNTNPASYYIEDALKNFEKQVKKYEAQINAKRKQLQELILKDCEDTQKFLIKVGKGTQTKLVDFITKKELKYKEELIKIRETVDSLIKTAPEKEKSYAMAYYK